MSSIIAGVSAIYTLFEYNIHHLSVTADLGLKKNIQEEGIFRDLRGGGDIFFSIKKRFFF
jgi:hypothetical protein